MLSNIKRNANISPSKRSFDQTALSAHPHHQRDGDAHYSLATSQNHFEIYLHPCSPSKRRSSSVSSTNIMLAGHNSIMSGSFPSFMSVYGSEESEVYRPIELDDQSKLEQNAFPFVNASSTNPQLLRQHSKPYPHRGSVPSLFSESTESSPTTTNSTFDSPLVSETSASSSPESATSAAPSNTFRTATMSSEGKIAMASNNTAAIATPEQSQSLQDATKNVKKLTLDMNLPALRRPMTAGGAIESSYPFSAPTSPLREPLKSARKKPTNLTIRTPAYNQLTFPRAAGHMPATPSNRPAIPHYQPSPGLPSIASPRGPPAGGMLFALPSLNTIQLNTNLSSNNRSSFMANSMPELREEIDNQIPKSQEAPEKGYIEGPVCIYDCGVYLYLEPTAAEASKFDIVINVAKEIRNPFKTQTGEGTVMSVWRSDPMLDRREITEPQTAISEYSFKSAWEWQPESTVTPAATTPTQSTFTLGSKQPEYVHVKWDHNSEILDDLYPLCKLIDDRTAAGKKVLIHCQLGVSRSASLIIAYGLFKNYQPNFHSMYMAVKERSRWVGPNMSLIYQLTDFKNKVDRGDESLQRKQPDPAWFIRSPEGPLTPTGPDVAPTVPVMQAPMLKTENVVGTNAAPEQHGAALKLNKALPPVPLFSNSPHLSRQPSASSSGFVPNSQRVPATVKRAASRPLPFRERGMDMNIPAHKPQALPGITLPQSSAIMDLAMKDVPSTPSLFSPRVTEFRTVPFNIRGAGDLETPGNRLSKEIPSEFNWLPLRKEGHVRTASKDPRSPHHQDETEGIFRSIDKYL